MIDLPLTRSTTSALRSAFLLHHRVTAESPLFGVDAAQMVRDEAELHVVVTGLDETTLQPVHATYEYLPEDVRWNARFVDMLRELPNGTIEVDLRRFHETATVRPSSGG